MNHEIGFGGGCYWCTEAVFQALRDVQHVEQGFMRSSPPDDAWSEAVIVHFDPAEIDLVDLIDVHLHTHASTSPHSMRYKYRSAIYCNSPQQAREANAILSEMQDTFSEPLVTRVLSRVDFKSSESKSQNYFNKKSSNQFCERYIEPMLEKLRDEYSHLIVDSEPI